MNNKSCNCEYCQLAHRIMALEQKLPSELVMEYNNIINKLCEKMESVELDLNVLNAKIQGSWPKEDDESEKYYHWIDSKKYEITAKETL